MADAVAAISSVALLSLHFTPFPLPAAPLHRSLVPPPSRCPLPLLSLRISPLSESGIPPCMLGDLSCDPMPVGAVGWWERKLPSAPLPRQDQVVSEPLRQCR